mmetsp:Transcript_54198/g.121224  ORF Transcript_54198/g.121224 Transcript_54198/m.121224 type:complete len:123 (-) Transcript_54198:291-659(-)
MHHMRAVSAAPAPKMITGRRLSSSVAPKLNLAGSHSTQTPRKECGTTMKTANQREDTRFSISEPKVQSQMLTLSEKSRAKPTMAHMTKCLRLQIEMTGRWSIVSAQSAMKSANQGTMQKTAV